MERIQAAEDGRAPAIAGAEVMTTAAAVLSNAQVDALRAMKAHTDFNDVAAKSVLGIEGVERQIRAHFISAMKWTGDFETERQQERVQTVKQAVKSEGEKPRRAAKIG